MFSINHIQSFISWYIRNCYAYYIGPVDILHYVGNSVPCTWFPVAEPVVKWTHMFSTGGPALDYTISGNTEKVSYRTLFWNFDLEMGQKKNKMDD